VKTGNDGGGGGFGGFDWGLRPGANQQSGAGVIVQELNVYGVQSGSELWATLQEEARRRGGSGGGTSFALGRA